MAKKSSSEGGKSSAAERHAASSLVPDPSSSPRTIETSSAESLCNKVHLEACLKEEAFYLDPETGYQVTTEFEHLRRGKCCRSGCRHCPYGFQKVKNS